ncbi:MAG: UDP binding domain-containing protein, partial [Acidobacteriota bacterium]
DIDDMRESPALGIVESLQELGAEVNFHDPYVDSIHLEGTDRHLHGIPLTDEVIAAADCVVIVTDHSNIDYGHLVSKAQLVVDTRNTTRKLKGGDLDAKVIRL